LEHKPILNFWCIHEKSSNERNQLTAVSRTRESKKKGNGIYEKMFEEELTKMLRFYMRLILIIFLIITTFFSPFSQLQNAYAQHGNQGITFDIYIDNHDIEVNQINKYQLHVSEKILCFNPNDESYSRKITVWAQENSEIIRFGPVINDSYMGGNYSQLSPVIYQYNLTENGYEIAANSSLQIILEYNIEFSSDEFTFEKTFYYSNYFLVVAVFPLENTEIESSGIILDYNEEENYYFTQDSSINMLGDLFTINFSPNESEYLTSWDDTNFPLLTLFGILAVVITCTLILFVRASQKKKRQFKSSSTDLFIPSTSPDLSPPINLDSFNPPSSTITPVTPNSSYSYQPSLSDTQYAPTQLKQTITGLELNIDYLEIDDKEFEVGGMSILKLAHDNINLARKYIAKVPRKDGPNRYETCLEKLKLEADVLSKCYHPNIVKHVASFERNKEFHLIIEYVDGNTLDELYNQEENINAPKLNKKSIIQIIIPVLEGLTHLHNDVKYIHRDINPSNIMLSATGRVVIIDFGTVKKREEKITTLREATQIWEEPKKGTIIFTKGYASPEQELYGVTHVQSDIFGVGAVMYFLTTGHAPQYFQRIPGMPLGPFPEIPQNLGFSDRFINIVKKATNNDPRLRYQSTEEMMSALGLESNDELIPI